MINSLQKQNQKNPATENYTVKVLRMFAKKQKINKFISALTFLTKYHEDMMNSQPM